MVFNICIGAKLISARRQLFKTGLAYPFRLELEKRRFMKKYFQVYKSAFEKFALNDELTQG